MNLPGHLIQPNQKVITILEKHGFVSTIQGWQNQHRHLIVSIQHGCGSDVMLCWSRTETSPWKHGSRRVDDLKELDQVLEDLTTPPAAD